jgi:hypothetical protein
MHRNSFAIVSWTALVVLTAYASIDAQEPVPAGNRLIPHIAIAGGLDMRNGESRYPDMYLGVASLEWRTRLPRLGLRLEALYASRSRDNRLQPQDCGSTCSPIPEISLASVYSSKVSAKGALLGATYEVLRQGPLRPYVVGGIGVVQTRDEAISRTSCSGSFCALANWVSALTIQDDRPTSGAAHVGGGASYTWRWISVVGEARYFAVTNGMSRGLNGALPVSLGVRLF